MKNVFPAFLICFEKRTNVSWVKNDKGNTVWPFKAAENYNLNWREIVIIYFAIQCYALERKPVIKYLIL